MLRLAILSMCCAPAMLVCLLPAVAGAQPVIEIDDPAPTVDARLGLTYTLTDPQAEVYAMAVDYVVGAGNTNYLTASPGRGGEGLESLASSGAGTGHTFVWDTLADLGTGVQNDVRLRFTVGTLPEGGGPLTPLAQAETTAFTVDTSVTPTTIRGTVIDAATVADNPPAPLENVLVEARLAYDDTVLLASDTTDATGAYTIDLGDNTTRAALTFTRIDYEPFTINNLVAPLILPVRLRPEAPPAPTRVTAFTAADETQVRWRGVNEDDLAGYHVYRCDDCPPNAPFSQYMRITTVPEVNTVFEDRDITAPIDGAAPAFENVYYLVTAIDTRGNESLPSPAVRSRADAIVVTMPDRDALPGDPLAVRLPINVGNLSGICPAGFDLEVSFPSGVFKSDAVFWDVQEPGGEINLAFNANFRPNYPVTGFDTIDFITLADCNEQLQSEGHFLDIFLTLEDTVMPGDNITVIFSEAKFVTLDPLDGQTLLDLETDFTDTATVRAVDMASIIAGSACLEADLDQNGIIDDSDVRIAQDIAVGRIEPNACQFQAGDLNGDSRLDSADATMIARIVAGLPINPDARRESILQAPDDITVTIGRVIDAPLGSTVVLPVDVAASPGDVLGFSAFDLKVSFTDQASNLEFLGVTPGDITEDFQLKSLVEDGAIVVSGISTTNLFVDSGTLVNLNFRVTETAPYEQEFPVPFSSIEFKRQYGESLQWTTDTGLSDGSVKIGVPPNLRVVVRDSGCTNDLVAGAAVTLATLCGATGQTVPTDQTGEATFLSVEGGEGYCLTVSKPGYTTKEQNIFTIGGQTNIETVSLELELPCAYLVLERFQQIDTQAPAGGLTSGELSGQFPGINAAQFAALDLNNNNQLSVPELFQAVGGSSYVHAADPNGDNEISLNELLRVIQFFNSQGYHCALDASPPTEDGYLPGVNPSMHACVRHSTDYLPTPWVINLSELLRIIQFYNVQGYWYCPDDNTEDGYSAVPCSQ